MYSLKERDKKRAATNASTKLDVHSRFPVSPNIRSRFFREEARAKNGFVDVKRERCRSPIVRGVLKFTLNESAFCPWNQL